MTPGAICEPEVQRPDSLTLGTKQKGRGPAR
jgi:hypothetical protein